jgi:PhzF family phenazine biosynthesis protein
MERAFSDERHLVFGTEMGGGNPAGVILVSGQVDAATLQARATAVGLPVSAFIQSGTRPSVRFFTRSAELPFCGHGALAAGAAIMARSGADHATLLCGTSEVRVERRDQLFVLTATTAWVREEMPAASDLLQALGVCADQVARLKVASVGSPKAIVELRHERILRQLAPDFEALARWSQDNQVNGAYVYAMASEGHPLARAFNPLGGNDEDAATGVGAGALAWALDHPLLEWLRVLQVGAHSDRCELYARRLDERRTEVGGRVSRLPEI